MKTVWRILSVVAKFVIFAALFCFAPVVRFKKFVGNATVNVFFNTLPNVSAFPFAMRNTHVINNLCFH